MAFVLMNDTPPREGKTFPAMVSAHNVAVVRPTLKAARLIGCGGKEPFDFSNDKLAV